ncbi:O-antigen ligase family protein [Eubacterium maltosivorans]|uniref:O-antigen ligase family protein n=1 Tax=Eubacterium maltosivorans TaxID=2041044 RepID=UPI00189C9874
MFVLLTFIFLFVNTGFGARFLSVFTDLSKIIKGNNWEEGGSYRLFIWSKTLELIKLRPLTGFGIETLGKVMGQYFERDIVRVTVAPVFWIFCGMMVRLSNKINQI